MPGSRSANGFHLHIIGLQGIDRLDFILEFGFSSLKGLVGWADSELLCTTRRSSVKYSEEDILPVQMTGMVCCL